MRRCIPYVQMHEFEGLLFSDPQALAASINKVRLSPKFTEIREQFSPPEDINDSPMSAPSKRITDLYSQYEKPTAGSIAALEIGLPKIRNECPLFDKWLTHLEKL